MSKLEQFSNPAIVYERAKRIYGPDVEIEYSTRKNKKYMLFNPNSGKWISFGQMGYKDYTKDGDEIRRKKFQQRNHKWASAPKYSASFNSYYLLW